MSYQDTYEAWLNSPALSAQEKAELESIRTDEKEKESRFFDQLSFGTAGLRGIMAVGLHNMNIHVIRHATQAFAQVILEEGAQAAQRGVAICFDCRNNSQTFAREAAQVMAANGIPVRLFQALRPTPELSFAVREYGCIAGINITASHNPKEYNGYKGYWEDGAQLPPKHADEVAKKMKELDVFDCVKTMDYDKAVAEGKIVIMGAETDEKFLANVMEQVNDKAEEEQMADTFTMVYTPFHGCGYKLVPEALTRLGIKHLYCEPKQMVIDGDFPTVVSPNPENPEGFYLAIDLAREKNVDFILGTDPDSDRVGIMVRTKEDDFVVISGNQTGVLLLDYLIGAKRRAGTLPENPVALKSELLMSICEQQMGEGQLGAFHKSIIDRCTASVYHDFIKSGGKARQPILSDWRNEIKGQPEREAQELALASELFVEGSLNMFAHETNVDIDSRIIVFDLYEMGDQLKPTALNVTMETIQNRVATNRLAGKYTWVFVDEVYVRPEAA